MKKGHHYSARDHSSNQKEMYHVPNHYKYEATGQVINALAISLTVVISTNAAVKVSLNGGFSVKDRGKKKSELFDIQEEYG